MDPRFFVLVCFVSSVLSVTSALHAAAISFHPSTTQEDTPEIQIKIVDQEGNPITNAVIHKSHVWNEEGSDQPTVGNMDFEVDENGTASWELPGSTLLLRIWARADGYVPVFANWEKEELATNKAPTEFTFQMISGVEIGGVVVDSDGQPISGARVDVKYRSQQKQVEGRVRIQSYLAFSDNFDEDGMAAVTDEQGRWSINNVPSNADAEFVIGVRHTDYLDIPISRDPRKQGVASIEALQNKTLVSELERGVAVTGKVFDAKGNILDRGAVVIGDNPLRKDGTQEFEIDINGEFHLPPLAEGEYRMTVVVPEFAPQSRIVEVGAMMDELAFELEPGYTTRIRVVDGNRNPIPSAFVQISRWQNTESIYNNRHPNLRDLGIPYATDEGGLFLWTWAPKDKVMYSIAKPGYTMQRKIELAPGDETHVIQLKPTLTISGTVVDQSTGENIDQFAVIPVKSLGGGLSRNREDRRNTVAGRNGRFRIQLGRMESDPERKFGFRIEAVGYKPMFSEQFLLGQAIDRMTIELEPQAWPTVRVLGVEGEFLNEALVRISSRTNHVMADGYRLDTGGNELSARTNEKGLAQIPPFDESLTVLVFDNNGYAEETFVDSNELKDVRLQKWASLKGTVFDVNDKPIPNLNVIFNGVRAGHGGLPGIQDSTLVTTDENGQFEFPRVPPIRGRVRTHMLTDRTEINRSSTPVLLKPGENVSIEIGKGIEIRGKFQLDGPTNLKVDHAFTHTVILPIAPPPYGWPDEIADSEFDWRGGWTAYTKLTKGEWKSPPRAWLDSVYNYSAKPGPDGSFSINVRESGEYDMAISLYANHPDSPGLISGNTAYRIHRFDVTEANQSDGFVDLGTIAVKAQQGPGLGAIVEDFQFLVNGVEKRLGSFQGKYVLLEFWSEGCKVCQQELPGLKAFASQHEETPNLQIVSLSIERGQNANRNAKAGETNWLNGKLTFENYAHVNKGLGIWSFPRYLVIDPEGKLVYHGALDGAIEELGKVDR